MASDSLPETFYTCMRRLRLTSDLSCRRQPKIQDVWELQIRWLVGPGGAPVAGGDVVQQLNSLVTSVLDTGDLLLTIHIAPYYEVHQLNSDMADEVLVQQGVLRLSSEHACHRLRSMFNCGRLCLAGKLPILACAPRQVLYPFDPVRDVPSSSWPGSGRDSAQLPVFDDVMERTTSVRSRYSLQDAVGDLAMQHSSLPPSLKGAGYPPAAPSAPTVNIQDWDGTGFDTIPPMPQHHKQRQQQGVQQLDQRQQQQQQPQQRLQQQHSPRVLGKRPHFEPLLEVLVPSLPTLLPDDSATTTTTTTTTTTPSTTPTATQSTWMQLQPSPPFPSRGSPSATVSPSRRVTVEPALQRMLQHNLLPWQGHNHVQVHPSMRLFVDATTLTPSFYLRYNTWKTAPIIIEFALPHPIANVLQLPPPRMLMCHTVARSPEDGALRYDNADAPHRPGCDTWQDLMTVSLRYPAGRPVYPDPLASLDHGAITTTAAAATMAAPVAYAYTFDVQWNPALTPRNSPPTHDWYRSQCASHGSANWSFFVFQFAGACTLPMRVGSANAKVRVSRVEPSYWLIAMPKRERGAVPLAQLDPDGQGDVSRQVGSATRPCVLSTEVMFVLLKRMGQDIVPGQTSGAWFRVDEDAGWRERFLHSVELVSYDQKPAAVVTAMEYVDNSLSEQALGFALQSAARRGTLSHPHKLHVSQTSDETRPLAGSPRVHRYDASAVVSVPSSGSNAFTPPGLYSLRFRNHYPLYFRFIEPAP